MQALNRIKKTNVKHTENVHSSSTSSSLAVAGNFPYEFLFVFSYFFRFFFKIIQNFMVKSVVHLDSITNFDWFYRNLHVWMLIFYQDHCCLLFALTFFYFYFIFLMHYGIIIVRNSIYDSQNLYAGACCDTGIMLNFSCNYCSGRERQNISKKIAGVLKGSSKKFQFLIEIKKGSFYWFWRKSSV